MSWSWPITMSEQKAGTIDEMLPIKATPGFVEIELLGSYEHGHAVTQIRIPAEMVDEVIARLAAARDAAALMQSVQK